MRVLPDCLPERSLSVRLGVALSCAEGSAGASAAVCLRCRAVWHASCCATSCGGGARGQSLQPNSRATVCLASSTDNSASVLTCNGCFPSHCTLHLLDSYRHSGHDKIARPGSVSSGTPFKSNPIDRRSVVLGRKEAWQANEPLPLPCIS